MKAVVIRALGGIEVLRYESVGDPKPSGEDEVVVAIKAASVNAADWLVRTGRYVGPPAPLPRILGRDFSGIVEAAGPAADLRVGEDVYGVCPNTLEGAYAERIAIPCGLVARKPPQLSYVQAAAIGLAGLTALRAVEDTLHVKPGERLFIQGGAGGVGSMAVQLAKHRQAFVATTTREINHEYVKALGADLVIDYTKDDPTEVLREYDASFDAVGSAVSVAQSFKVLKRGGRAAFISSGLAAPEPPRPDLVSLRPSVVRGREGLDRLSALVVAGALRAPHIHEMPLAEVQHAHALSEAGHVRGKIVLIP